MNNLGRGYPWQNMADMYGLNDIGGTARIAKMAGITPATSISDHIKALQPQTLGIDRRDEIARITRSATGIDSLRERMLEATGALSIKKMFESSFSPLFEASKTGSLSSHKLFPGLEKVGNTPRSELSIVNFAAAGAISGLSRNLFPDTQRITTGILDRIGPTGLDEVAKAFKAASSFQTDLSVRIPELIAAIPEIHDVAREIDADPEQRKDIEDLANRYEVAELLSSPPAQGTVIIISWLICLIIVLNLDPGPEYFSALITEKAGEKITEKQRRKYRTYFDEDEEGMVEWLKKADTD